jgi:mannose-1-phosphate guanylyltransferase
MARAGVPKQFLSITGGRTLLQETARRLLPLVPWERMLVVTGGEHAAQVRRQVPRIPRGQVLSEPVGRNTAACIALAAEWITARAGDALMVVVPADHAIKDAHSLRRALRKAIDLAAGRDCLVTLGVAPSRPETGYGYIELGRVVERSSPGAFWVRRFHEKPAASVAKRYVASGRHLWNSGMFVWKASVFREALRLCAPRVGRALDGLWQSRRGLQARLRRAYGNLPSVSVDVAVLQPISAMRAAAPRIAAVPAHCDWTDVGSWGAVGDLWRHDIAGNAALGRLLPIDARGSIVYCPHRVVALVGVDDLIVVDSSDALLVCARERAQDVRKVREELKKRGWGRYV